MKTVTGLVPAAMANEEVACCRLFAMKINRLLGMPRHKKRVTYNKKYLMQINRLLGMPPPNKKVSYNEKYLMLKIRENKEPSLFPPNLPSLAVCAKAASVLRSYVISMGHVMNLHILLRLLYI